jgi:hypothetical protein
LFVNFTFPTSFHRDHSVTIVFSSFTFGSLLKAEQDENNCYLIIIGLLALLMRLSAILDILSTPIAVEGMHIGIGNPIYFVPFT